LLGVGLAALVGCAPGGEPPQPTRSALALPEGLSVDARILVITADGSDPAYAAITQTLQYLGTPYDTLNAKTGAALTADFLGTADHGKYQAIFVDVADLTAAGTATFTDAQWTILQTYEAKFGVRRVSLYTVPSATYGLTSAGAAINSTTTPITTTCTTAGAAAFVGANCANPVVINSGTANPAHAADAQTVPLLTDAAGNVYAATRTYPDGREGMTLTFAQLATAVDTLELAYGLVSWATRGLFVGERHVYLMPQLDDFFLASALYPDASGATYRITGTELQTLADWQKSRQANPLLSGFRIAFAMNCQGAGPVATDDLVAKAEALGPAFAWISHTWDHAELTTMAYLDVMAEWSLNDQAITALELTPYSKLNAVTPGITGLDNVNAMQASYDSGIRYLVSDASIAAQANPSPNVGFYNALVPGILEIPRIATNLDYDLSQPSEWIAYWEANLKQTLTYDQIVAAESQNLLGYLLTGNNDPMMFHQANARDIGGGHSMLTDLLGATLDAYLKVATFPVVSPTQDNLGQRVIDRMGLNASGVSATIGPGSQITVKVTNAAKVPITGLCTPTAETYGAQKISYVSLAAGGTTTLSIADCSAPPDAGAPDARDAGAPGTGKGGAPGDASPPPPDTTGRGGAGGSGHTGGGGGAGCGCALGRGASGPGGLLVAAAGLILAVRRRRPRSL
jgi:MYXO-CTERM domain-containing protein